MITSLAYDSEIIITFDQNFHLLRIPAVDAVGTLPFSSSPENIVRNDSWSTCTLYFSRAGIEEDQIVPLDFGGLQKWHRTCTDGPFGGSYVSEILVQFNGNLSLCLIVPTRLYALKHGASLVWSPETVDKAILIAERVVDRKHRDFVYHGCIITPFAAQTGVVSYNGKSRAIFTCHPLEKPYLIYQIGSSDPKLAVQAAKKVMNDVSGIDLNCGCPKPFSTHSGMGAALLTNPDLLCSILTALREAMPPHITVSAKIRLLPSQEDTLKLVERIVNTGISALTVHCRTRNMREKDRAVIERMREIVEFVEGMGKGIAVLENGDCLGAEDAKRVKAITGELPACSPYQLA